MKVATYKIRRQIYADSARNSYSVTIPSDIAERLLDAGVPELELLVTEEGMLYRVPLKEEAPEPTWLKGLAK